MRTEQFPPTVRLGVWAVVLVAMALGIPLFGRLLEARTTEAPHLEPAELEAWTAYHAACEVAWSSRIGGETEEIVAACADRMIEQRRARAPR